MRRLLTILLLSVLVLAVTPAPSAAQWGGFQSQRQEFDFNLQLRFRSSPWGGWGGGWGGREFVGPYGGREFVGPYGGREFVGPYGGREFVGPQFGGFGFPQDFRACPTCPTSTRARIRVLVR